MKQKQQVFFEHDAAPNFCSLSKVARRLPSKRQNVAAAVVK
ncbi:MAG: hypothetical protein ACR2PV_05815 [Gammaproteobacteria bacterium]